MSFWLFSSHSTSLCFLIVSAPPNLKFVDVPVGGAAEDSYLLGFTHEQKIAINWVMNALSDYMQDYRIEVSAVGNGGSDYGERLYLQRSHQGMCNDLIFIPFYVCFELVVGSSTISGMRPRICTERTED